MKSLCYINGKIISAANGQVGITDLGLQRGYGVFDFVRSYNGKLFHLEEHIERLRRSGSEVNLKLPVSNKEIHEISKQLIKDSDLHTPAIRLILTGGYSRSSLLSENPNFIMIAEELPTFPSELYTQGAQIITVEYQRELPHVKSINYLNAARLEPLKREKGAFDILYHFRHGVTECPQNNFFIFQGDTLVTPSGHILYGITRRLVLKLSEKHFTTQERPVSIDELEIIDEAFVTSTSKDIIPVTRIEGKNVGDGSVGPRTKKIMELFDEYTQSY